MAITTYATLKTAIGTWTNRGDSSRWDDDVIDLTEAWFNRNFRVRQMETSLTAPVISAAGVVTHPSDWLGWKSLKVTTTPVSQIEIATEENAPWQFETTSAVTGDRPKRAVVRGAQTLLTPSSSTSSYSYDFVYYAAIPALSTAQTTNWLLNAYPDAYLYGCLAGSGAFVQDQELLGQWTAAFKGVIQEITGASGRDKFSGQSIATRAHRVA